jgi:hypothetical protein
VQGYTVEVHKRTGQTLVNGWAWRPAALGFTFDRYRWSILVRAPLAQAQAAAYQVLFLQTIVGLIALVLAMAALRMAAVVALGHRTSTTTAEHAAGVELGTLASDALDLIYRNLYERIGDVQAFALTPRCKACIRNRSMPPPIATAGCTISTI